MRMRLAFLLVFAFLFSGCGGNGGEAVKKPEPVRNERDFCYENTVWGMPLEEVLENVGIPDMRSDEQPENEDDGNYISYEIKNADGSSSPPTTNESQGEYIDFHYYNKPIFNGKYTAEEKYLFDENRQLWGVIDSVYIGEVSKDLMNYEEVVACGKESYMDIRSILTERYGPPAAEYTAYADGGSYKTDELLDLDRENAVICASRWDGDNYRFIYVMYFFNDVALDVRYIPHDKETVDAANQSKSAG